MAASPWVNDPNATGGAPGNPNYRPQNPPVNAPNMLNQRLIADPAALREQFRSEIGIAPDNHGAVAELVDNLVNPLRQWLALQGGPNQTQDYATGVRDFAGRLMGQGDFMGSIRNDAGNWLNGDLGRQLEKLPFGQSSNVLQAALELQNFGTNPLYGAASEINLQDLLAGFVRADNRRVAAGEVNLPTLWQAVNQNPVWKQILGLR